MPKTNSMWVKLGCQKDSRITSRAPFEGLESSDIVSTYHPSRDSRPTGNYHALLGFNPQIFGLNP